MKVLMIIPLVVLFNDRQSIAFNLSPVPNYQLKPPVTTPGDSLFGLSLAVTDNELIIGAPKMSQSPGESERGEIYKCSYGRRGFCTEFNPQTRYIRPETLREKQFLGFSMDASDKFVTCAPNVKINRTNEYYLHGACYWIPNGAQENAAVQIDALRDPQLQLIETDHNQKTYYYMFGQQGFSVHVSDNGEEILMGAPGVYNWKGSVVRYRKVDSIEAPGRERRQVSDYDYVTNVINPGLAGVQNDSYLGYSVASGFFDTTNTRRLLYLASAPQGNDQSGVVYLFEFIRKGTDSTMNVLNRFETEQMGDYFGYSLVVEDVNGDGVPDFLVGAPMYSKEMMYDNGAVYVYLNQKNLNFKRDALLLGNLELGGRFGTAIGKIGDVDLDGFNDIAIGAPFENNGAVYIYRGGSRGLNPKPSQRIAPSTANSLLGNNQMFGYSISKGVDIDKNLYNDIIIGAPNSEEVMVFKSYPVGKVEATLTSSKTEVTKDDRTLKLTGCWRLSTQLPMKSSLDLHVTLKADVRANRARWESSNSTIYKVNSFISNQKQCLDFTVTIEYKLAEIFKPLLFEMEFELVNVEIGKQEFCEKCYVLAPGDSNYVKTEVAFNTGCATNPCVSDLKIVGEFIGVSDNTYILGSTKTLPINYVISNNNEPAYLSELKIELRGSATFAKIPPECKLVNESGLDCELNYGNPIKKGDSIQLGIFISTAAFDGQEFVIVAEVSSSGDERNPLDNKLVQRLRLAENSIIDIIGKPHRESLLLKDMEDEETISHSIEIINRGPSVIKEGLLYVYIPTFYKKLEVINAMDIEIDVKHGNKMFHNQSTEEDLDISHTRQRRAAAKRVKVITSIADLPPERTIHFTCSEILQAEHACFIGKFPVTNFLPGNEVISVNVTYTIKTNTTKKLFDDRHDIFVFETYSKLTRVGSYAESIHAVASHPFTVVFAKATGSTPWWVYFLSILAGIVVLAVLVYVMYRIGFFKRKVKEELEQQKRESMAPGTEMQPLASRSES